jgi:UDP-N-acetylmuramoyl-L-alanyl-D-glutamate--2,6-diaminopimelate ligase
MEVSSIAIAELRCLGLTYKALIYTNFSEDHLDYHKNMDNYFYTKTIPFYKLNKGVAIVNIDDYKSKELIQNIDSKVITYGYKNGEYKALEPTVTKNGISFDYLELKFSSKMLGSFNIYNILSILVLSDYFGIDLRLYQKFLSDYNGVSGRMNLIDNSKMVIIDYAHTEEAVKQVVYEAINICNGKLYIVIGCGGNREKEKRSKIGEFLDNFSGGVILTTDNPRFEDPIDIISDIKSNMKNEVITIISRKEAIEYALNKMNDDDCLLILGKGSEDYMEVMGIKYQYSDLEVCNDWFRSH